MIVKILSHSGYRTSRKQKVQLLSLDGLSGILFFYFFFCSDCVPTHCFGERWEGNWQGEKWNSNGQVMPKWAEDALNGRTKLQRKWTHFPACGVGNSSLIAVQALCCLQTPHTQRVEEKSDGINTQISPQHNSLKKDRGSILRHLCVTIVKDRNKWYKGKACAIY